MEAVVKFNHIHDCHGCREKIVAVLKTIEGVKGFCIDAENNKVTVFGKFDDLDRQVHLIQKFKKKFPLKEPELIMNNNNQNNNNSNGNGNGDGNGNGGNGNGNGGQESEKGKEKVHGSNGSKRGGGDIASSSGSGNGNGNGNGGGKSGNQPPQMDMMSYWDPWMGHYPQPMMNSGYYQGMRQDMDVYDSIPTYRGPPPPMPAPATFYSNPPHTIFSDDNANGCSIM